MDKIEDAPKKEKPRHKRFFSQLYFCRLLFKTTRNVILQLRIN